MAGRGNSFRSAGGRPRRARSLVAFASKATLALYRVDVAYFWAWAYLACGLVEEYPVPSEVVLQFARDQLYCLDPTTNLALRELGLIRRRRFSPQTVIRRLSALAAAHRQQGLVEPPSYWPELRALLAEARHRRILSS